MKTGSFKPHPLQLTRYNATTLKIAADATGESLTLDHASKQLIISNNGAKTAYLTFDNAAPSTDGFSILSGQTVTIDCQVEVVSAKCGGTDTTDLRILNIW